MSPQRIDAHHHLWNLADRPQSWLDGPDMAAIRRDFTVTDLLAETSAARIDRTILVQVLPDLDETVEFLALAGAGGADSMAGGSQVSAGRLESITGGSEVPAGGSRLSPGGSESMTSDSRLSASATEPLADGPEVPAGGSQPIAGVVGWVDLTAGQIAEVLAGLRAVPGGDKLVGIRHLVQGEPDPAWLNRADVRRGLRAVADAGLVYDLLTMPHQLPAALDTVRALPELTFVLDHISKPPIASGELEPWASRIRELAGEPNVYCKLSGMVTEADRVGWQIEDLRPYAEVVLDAFSPARVMFGSDWPVCLLAASYSEVCDSTEQLIAHLSPGERADIFGGTAARAYRLPDVGP